MNRRLVPIGVVSLSGLLSIAIVVNSVAVAHSEAVTLKGGALAARSAIPGSQVSTQTKLRASLPVPAAKFGQSVAIAGNVAVIGAPGDIKDGTPTGAAYVFVFDGSRWNEHSRLTASDGAAADAFGQSVAIDNDRIVVGATGNDQVGLNSGAAYVFDLDGRSWTQQAKLVPNSPSDVFFGHAVAVDGDRVAVGAPYSDSGTTNSGAAYVFRFDGSAWVQSIKLATRPGGGPVVSDLFGWDVALDSGTLVVGAYLANAAFVYQLDGATWRQVARLSGADTVANDRFGYSVDIDSGTIAVGAVEEDDAGNNAGAAYIFHGAGSGWTQQAKLLLPGTMPGSRLGWSVAMRGEMLLVGARESKGNKDQTEAGAAYVYTRQGNAWSRTESLFANDSNAHDFFGASVALDGSVALVGAPGTDGGGVDAGAAYVFSGSDTGGPPRPTPTIAPTASTTAAPTTVPTPGPTATTPPLPTPDPAQPCETMIPGDETSEDVAPGAQLTWRGAYRCIDAPDQGRYRFTLVISNAGSSASPASVDGVELTHTTPRPHGEGPQATASTSGVPVVIAPGASANIIVAGTYSLVGTDEGKKANLHFCVRGETEAGDPFYLGVNALIRGAGAQDALSSPPNPPTIANVVVLPTWQGAVIKWTTDRPSFSRVLYGPGSIPIHSRPAGCGGTTSHEVVLNKLDAGQTYVYQIRASDEFGSVGETGLNSFTPASNGTFVPIAVH